MEELMRIIRYYDRINSKNVYLKVNDEVSKFLQNSDKQWQRQQEECYEHNISLNKILYEDDDDNPITLEDVVPDRTDEEFQQTDLYKRNKREFEYALKQVAIEIFKRIAEENGLKINLNDVRKLTKNNTQFLKMVTRLKGKLPADEKKQFTKINRTVKQNLDKLNADFSPRANNLFDNDKKLKVTDFEKRLCGKKGEDIHDICHLYIDYYHAGYGGIQATECIEVDDVKTDEEIEKLEKQEEETGEWCYYYEGGYCKKTNDGAIIIAVGKNAKDTINKLCNNK